MPAPRRTQQCGTAPRREVRMELLQMCTIPAVGMGGCANQGLLKNEFKITHSTRTKAVQQHVKELQEPNVGPHQQSRDSGGTPKGCSTEGGLSPSTAFLQHPPKHPASPPCLRLPSWEQCCKQDFFPCFAFQWLTETCCKTPQEVQVYNSLQSKPEQQRPSPQAHTFWVEHSISGCHGYPHTLTQQSPNPALMI